MSHESRKALTRIDPRAPLVLDLRALNRRPGSMRELTSTVPAPADLGTEMVGVPEGADIELDLRLESVLEGVLVTGTARMPLTGECARCLDPLEDSFDAEFQELYVYTDTRSGVEAGEDERRVEDDLIDLEPVLRDTVVLALPLSPLCRDDCPGLCPDCGVRLADAGPDHHHDVVDPRWAALQGLTDLRDGKQEG
ncbi:YceD family protein [Thermomonospora umbrina]|uniref:Metal-binding protein n=1 Tax=Thermomonospora umbrina TaxID=111806 RepID=A0A3D9SSX1_9ACTN|nr:YceD family protein [Thermomonospora umbrina]REE99076.1 uncharacterized protein DFJ69_4581 [Thermomonospora umbrina]